MFKFKKSISLLFTLIFLTSLVSVQAKKVNDTTPPTVPTNLTATQIKTNSITLSWNVSTDNVKIDSYYIYKNSTYIAMSNSTKYNITGLTANTTYSFTVKAKDSSGNMSESSNILNVTTLTNSPTVTPTPAPTSSPIITPTPTASAEPTQTPVQSKYVIGYYSSWSSYSGFTPDKVKASNLTHINYAFANIGSDLKIALGDPQIDTSNISKLNSLKAVNPNLKTLISVGGWDWSGKFSDAALSDSSRIAFADSCVQFIKNYGFDGIDIDWEYPVSGGLSTNVRRPEDKQNFTLLLKTIREKLDLQGSIDGKYYLLSIAGGAGSWYCNNVELNLISQYLDYAIIMTYDIHGTWDKYTDFNAPLYNLTETSPQYKWSVDSSVNAWILSGFSADKIVIGVPFYGYVYNSVYNSNNGLYQIFSGGTSITYDNVISKYLNNSAYTRFYNQQAFVPWLWNGSTFISYDDAQSIQAKAEYVKTKQLAGASAWHLGGDLTGALLGALFEKLK